LTITSTIDSLCWRAHWQSLKYRLGDYCFWHFRFKDKVVDARVTCYFSDEKLLHGLIATVGEAKTSYVIESFPAPKPLPKLAINGKHLRYVPVQYLRYYIEFRGSFEQYLKNFSPKSRYNLARSARMLAELDGGRLDCREYRLPKQMADFHQLADGLSKRTYQERVLREGFVNRVGSYEDLQELAKFDAVRGYVLFNAGQAIAYVFCRCYSDTLLYDVMGYDTRFHRYSPSSVLLYVIIQKIFAEGTFKYLDFGEGGSWYKEFWSTGVVRCARGYYFPIIIRIISAVLMHMTSNAISDLLGMVLARLGLRRKVRQLLRQRVLSAAHE